MAEGRTFAGRIPFIIHLQDWIGWLVYAPGFWWVIAFIKFGVRLKIENHDEWRRYYKTLTDEKFPPLLICPNHLSYFDSIILIWAFGFHFSYPLQMRRHPWNLVAKEYAKNPLFRFVCFFSRCFYVDRVKEQRENYPALNTALGLLRRGDIVLIFPEGRRSKTGRFDDTKLAYGVGKLAAQLGECRVLCTYLRAAEQREKATGFPPWKGHYKIFTEVVHYKSTDWGGEAGKEKASVGITRDISERIKKLEKVYFATLNQAVPTAADSGLDASP